MAFVVVRNRGSRFRKIPTGKLSVAPSGSGLFTIEDLHSVEIGGLVVIEINRATLRMTFRHPCAGEENIAYKLSDRLSGKTKTVCLRAAIKGLGLKPVDAVGLHDVIRPAGDKKLEIRFRCSKRNRPWLDKAIRDHYATEGLLGTMGALHAAGHDVTKHTVVGRARQLGIRRIGLPIRQAGFNDSRLRDSQGRLKTKHDDGYLPSPDEIRAQCLEIRELKTRGYEKCGKIY